MSEYSYDIPRRSHRTREPEYVTETTYIERGGRSSGAPVRSTDLVYRPAREDSIEDIPRDFPPPGGSEYRQTRYREEYAPRRTRSVTRDDYYDRYDRGRRPRDRDYDEYTEYSERPKPSRRKSIVDQVKDFGESAGLGAVIGAVTGRNRSRSKSRHRDHDRGYDSDRYGYDDRRDRRYDSRSRSRSRGGRKSEKWEQAAKAALVAGAVEAFRSRKVAGPWTGEKGQRIATAALGAAGIDGLIDRDPEKHEKRHVVESALGGIAASRLANGSRSRSRARGRDSSRSPSRTRSRSRSIFGRSRSRGRSRSGEREGTGNGLAKAAGTGAVIAAGKALYDRVRSKSRSRKERSRSRSSSRDSYVPSRRGNRRSYSRGRGMDDYNSEAPNRANPDRRLAAAGGAGALAAPSRGGGDEVSRSRRSSSSDSESSTDMEERRKKLRAAYPTSYADANPYAAVPPPPMGARY